MVRISSIGQMTVRSPAPTRPVRLSAAERRRQIVLAGSRVALADGLDAVTLRRVAGELGITFGLVNHYFPAVNDLVGEAFEHAVQVDLDETFAVVSRSRTPTTRMRTLLRRWVSPERDRVGMLWMAAWSRAAGSPGFHRVVQRQMLEGHRRVQELIASGVAAGAFRAPDPGATAWTLLTLLDGLIVHSTVGVQEPPLNVRHAVTELMERELSLPVGSLSATRAGLVT